MLTVALQYYLINIKARLSMNNDDDDDESVLIFEALHTQTCLIAKVSLQTLALVNCQVFDLVFSFPFWFTCIMIVLFVGVLLRKIFLFKFILALTLHKGIIPVLQLYTFHRNHCYDPEDNHIEQQPKGRKETH